MESTKPARTPTPARAPLLGLPAELRNKIYHLALPTDETQKFRFDHQTKHRMCASVPAILQTCRRLHKEALPIYYGTCEFHVTIYLLGSSSEDTWIEDSVRHVLAWLRNIDADARKHLVERAQGNVELAYRSTFDWDTKYWTAKMAAKHGSDLHKIWERGQRELKGQS